MCNPSVTGETRASASLWNGEAIGFPAMSELAIFRRFRVSTPQLVVVTGILFVIGWFIPMMGCHASGENWPQVWAIWLFVRLTVQIGALLWLATRTWSEWATAGARPPLRARLFLGALGLLALLAAHAPATDLLAGPRIVEGPVRPTHMVVRRKAWTAQVEAVAISYQGEDVLVPCTATQCQSLRNAKAMRVRWLRTSELPLTYEVP